MLLDQLIPIIAEKNLPACFRANRGTVDMIFVLRQLQGGCREQDMDLYAAFIDLNKAFDMVSRGGLWPAAPLITPSTECGRTTHLA